MGFAFPLLLALLWLCSVDGLGLGRIRERDGGAYHLQHRELDCGSGSTVCGRGAAGCIPTAACCNAQADCE